MLLRQTSLNGSVHPHQLSKELETGFLRLIDAKGFIEMRGCLNAWYSATGGSDWNRL